MCSFIFYLEKEVNTSQSIIWCIKYNESLKSFNVGRCQTNQRFHWNSCQSPQNRAAQIQIHWTKANQVILHNSRTNENTWLKLKSIESNCTLYCIKKQHSTNKLFKHVLKGIQQRMRWVQIHWVEKKCDHVCEMCSACDADECARSFLLQIPCKTQAVQ